MLLGQRGPRGLVVIRLWSNRLNGEGFDFLGCLFIGLSLIIWARHKEEALVGLGAIGE